MSEDTPPAAHIETLDFEAPKDGPLTVFLEPWAEDYTCAPGERLTFRIKGRGSVLIQIVDRDFVNLWANTGDLQFSVHTQSGEEVRCGHNHHLISDEYPVLQRKDPKIP